MKNLGLTHLEVESDVFRGSQSLDAVRVHMTLQAER